jgi:hypothetical protein
MSPPFHHLVIVLLTADRQIVGPQRSDFDQTIGVRAERVKGSPQPCGALTACPGIDI